MSETELLLLILAMILTAIAVIIVGSILILRAFLRCPSQYRGHFVTAFIWTMITGIQTIYLVSTPQEQTPLALLVLLIAGLVFVPSWGQLQKRRQGNLPAQKWLSLPARFFLQTLWGPLAFWAIIRVIGQVIPTRHY